MNITKKQHASLLWFVLILITVCTSCKNDEDFQNDNNNPLSESTSTNTEVNNALIFNSAQFKSGNAPTNSNLGDLKINKDTINIWPGIQNRISILNHTNITIAGVLVHILDADGYHDVDIQEEESNDTLTVFYVDIDPDGLDLPYENYITISPTDGSGNVIDEFPHIIHVDTPFDGNTGSGPDGTGQSTCNPAIEKNLYWMSTHFIISNQEKVFQDAPGYPFYVSDYDVEGCCVNGNTVPCGTAAPNSTVAVTEQTSKTDFQHLYFFETGDYLYQMNKTFNDYSPEDTDFCNNIPGYSLRTSGMAPRGDYSITPDNSYGTSHKVTIHSTDFTTQQLIDLGYNTQLPLNEGSTQIEYYLGCQYFVLRIDSGEGSEYLSVYENIDDFDLWYD